MMHYHRYSYPAVGEFGSTFNGCDFKSDPAIYIHTYKSEISHSAKLVFLLLVLKAYVVNICECIGMQDFYLY